jgi:hypothetical protein
MGRVLVSNNNFLRAQLDRLPVGQEYRILACPILLLRAVLS